MAEGCSLPTIKIVIFVPIQKRGLCTAQSGESEYTNVSVKVSDDRKTDINNKALQRKYGIMKAQNSLKNFVGRRGSFYRRGETEKHQIPQKAISKSSCWSGSQERKTQKNYSSTYNLQRKMLFFLQLQEFCLAFHKSCTPHRFLLTRKDSLLLFLTQSPLTETNLFHDSGKKGFNIL